MQTKQFFTDAIDNAVFVSTAIATKISSKISNFEI